MPAHRVKTVRGRHGRRRRRDPAVRRRGRRRAARWFRDQGIATIGVCFLHSYADDRARARDARRSSPREHPEAVVSISSEVLREYREYERSVTTLVDAAVKPNIRRVRREHQPPPGASSARARRGDAPFYVMKSNGGVLVAEEVVHQPITTVLSGPAAGALGAAVVAEEAGFRQVRHLRRRRYVDRRHGRDRRPAGADHRGARRRLPEQDPDDRRGHRRRRRRLDRLDLARGHAQGRPAVGRRRPGPDVLPRRGAPSRPSPTRTPCSAGSRRTCSAARCRWTSTWPRRASATWPGGSASARGVRHRHPGDLGVEPGQRAAPGHRQPRPRRPRLHHGHLRRLRLAAGLPAGRHPRPRRACWSRSTPATCRRTACSPSTSATTTCGPPSPGSRRSTPAAVQGCFDDLAGQADAALAREGFAGEQRRFVRTADLRYYGQAYEVRVDVPDGPVTASCSRTSPDAFHDEHRRSTATTSATTPARRSSGSTSGSPASARSASPRCREVAAGDGARDGAHRRPRGLLRRLGRAPVYDRARLGAGDVVDGPAVLEEFSSTVPLHPGFAARVDGFGNLVITRSDASDRRQPYRLTDAARHRPGPGARRDRRGLPRLGRAWRSRPRSGARRARR